MRALDARAAFERRYGEWRRRIRDQGAAHAFPYAWRLPEPARALSRQDFARAQLALAQTFFMLGRFAEALAAIADVADPPADERPRVLGLRARCHVVLGLLSVTPPQPSTLDEYAESAHLDLLSDRPESMLAYLPAYLRAAEGEDEETAWCEIFSIWARARSRRIFSPAEAQAALSRLRPLTAAGAAHAEAVLAEAAFHHDPSWSIVWLDAALNLCARYGQHHVEVRLLHCKSRALEVAGQFMEAERFQGLASALALRQGTEIDARVASASHP